MTDRIERAYQLRLSVWTWLRGNPYSSVYELAEAMPDYHMETLRKTIRDMRLSGSITAHGPRTRTHRFTVALPPKTAAETRAALADCARLTIARRRGTAAPDRIAIGDCFERTPTSGPDPKRPGVYCHQSGGLGYRSQGGQGALRHHTFIQCGGSYL